MKKLNEKKGYALLFTMVIVSVIMAIATGISTSISKQLVLSGTALESQVAFYEADTAAECALYAIQVLGMPDLILPGPPYNQQFDCGQDSAGNLITLDVSSVLPNIYDIVPNLPPSYKGPCFHIEVDESVSPAVAKAFGYNMCNSPNNRNVVERGIEIIY